MVDESENSFDTVSSSITPPIYVTPRIPIMRSSPLSTKREKQIRTPQFRRPAPKVAKTAPPMKSIYYNMQCRLPRLITYNGSTEPLHSPIYHKDMPLTYFEQCFKVDSVIGKGSFGEVFAVQSLEDSHKYAVKVSIQLIRQNCASKYREVENHMRLPKHSNLVEFVKAWEEGGRLYIQQELCKKSLLQHCMEKHALPESEIWNIMIDLLKAVDHLHSNDMIHDDIKPDNIFLSAHSICKLGDFGLVINLRNPRDVDSAEEGDSKYLAPEVLNGSPSKASDIFSLGVTLLEAATDLDVPSNGESWHQIRNGEIPDRFFSGVSPQLRRLIEWMLSSDPASRPTTKELLSQPSVRAKLLKRQLYVGVVELQTDAYSWAFVVITWCLALFSFLLHPLLAAFSAVCNRRRSICALSVSKQHTPIQTPEGSKVFARSLSMSTPFDFSDDENTSFQRTLFPPIPRWEMNDDDDDEVPTSSSNSSVTESFISSSPTPNKIATVVNESPKRRIVPSPWNSKNGRTPQSARRLIPFSSSARKNAHHGDGDFENISKCRKMNNEDDEMLKWQKQKYERMMQMEACMDSDDNDAVISQQSSRLGPIPQSCPPLLRSVRKLKIPRAPKLDFSVLDAEKEDCHDSNKCPPSHAIRSTIRSSLRSRMIADQGSSADEV